MTRIAGGGVSARNPFGPQWSARAEKAGSVGDQVHLTLFGKKKPQKLDIEDMGDRPADGADARLAQKNYPPRG